MFWRYWRNDVTRTCVEGLACRRPWDRTAPHAAEHALQLQGMLGVGESKLLFELARRCFTGQGTVVDAGSFLGKSASLFAAGLLANRRASSAMKKIHCFDNFLVNEEGTVKFIQTYLGHEVSIGDSIREWFDQQTEHVQDLLEVHAGDFLAARWTAGLIELLLVDIAKSQALWSQVLAEMFPQLIPGVSLVVHQDYHHTWLPHIHVVMEYLYPYFELVIPRVDSSAVFLLLEEIPAAKLDRAIQYDFTAAEREALMDAAIARIPSDQRLAVQRAKSMMVVRDCDNSASVWEAIQMLESAGSSGLSVDEVSRVAVQMRQAMKQAGWSAVQSQNWPKVINIAEHLAAAGEDDDTVLMRSCALIGSGRFREAEDDLLSHAPTFTGTGAHKYFSLALARAVLNQGRHEEAELYLLENLDRHREDTTDPSLVSRHLELLGELFQIRGMRDKDRAAIEILQKMMPGHLLIERFAEEFPH